MSSECCLEEVFRKCPLLEVVDMREVTTVTNRSLLVLLEYCSKLRQVLVQGCSQVALQTLRHPKSSKVAFDVNDQEDPSAETNNILKILGQI